VAELTHERLRIAGEVFQLAGLERVEDRSYGGTRNGSAVPSLDPTRSQASQAVRGAREPLGGGVQLPLGSRTVEGRGALAIGFESAARAAEGTGPQGGTTALRHGLLTEVKCALPLPVDVQEDAIISSVIFLVGSTQICPDGSLNFGQLLAAGPLACLEDRQVTLKRQPLPTTDVATKSIRTRMSDSKDPEEFS
jgi:hypothetical protein